MDSPTSSAAAAAAPAASTADPPSSDPSSPSLARSSSSSPDPTNPSPSPTSSPPTAAAATAPDAAAPPSASSSHRRVPPPCWSMEETIALIDAYQDKWYSLRRGNLRASDWQDVADAVAARGPRRLAPAPAPANNPLSSSSAPKTAVQCRHKVEKLRKRYRAERQRSLKRNPRAPPKSSWEFFRKMHALETGGPALPPQAAKKGGGGVAAAAGMAGSGSQARRGTGFGASPLPSSPDEDDEGNDEDSNNGHQHRFRHTRPLNGLMMMTTADGPGSSVTRHGGALPAAAPPGFRFKVPKAVRTKLLSPRGEAAAMAARHHGSRPFGGLPRHQMPSTHGIKEMRNKLLDKKRKHHAMQTENDDDDDHNQAAAHYGGGGMGEVAEAVRMLGDGFMRMERMKMDMAMQIHKLRMETEMKRTQMMLDSNRKIVDMMLGGATGASNKRAKANT